MRNIYFIFVVGVMLSLTSCIPENLVNLNDVEDVESVTVIAPSPIQFEPMTGSAMTKGTSVEDGNTLLFSWAVGDTLGIFPNKGNQVEFPITAVQGTTSATFDGGGWALRNNASYAAYYPFSVWNYHRDNETILLDYSGQVQDGNGSFAHLSAYDFLASNKTTPQNSVVTFQMERQGSILYIDIVVPEPETITALTISCDEAIFVEKAALDISGNTPAITPVEMSKTLTLFFKNTVTTAKNETVRAYMAVQPVDFSDKTVMATLVTDRGRYSATVTPRAVNKGRAAFLRFSDDFTPVNIQFADAEVKRICVENWDTDGDGELSYSEASAVTDLGIVFKSNKAITSFNELVFFTSITEIPVSAFYYCDHLKSIVVPQNVTFIGYSAFSTATQLSSVAIEGSVTEIAPHAFDACNFEHIDLPETLTTIGSYAFQGCRNLSHFHVPESVISIGTGVFALCNKMQEFSGKFSSTDGHSLVVNGKLMAIATSGMTEYIVPENVTTIGGSSMSSGSNLTSIIIPEGVTTIEGSSIQSCEGITSISLPQSLTNLGDWNFTQTCYKLQNFSGKFASSDGRCLIVNGTMKAFAHAGLTEYVVPNEVTEIGNGVFYYCSSLISITLPENITSIGQDAFYLSGITHISIPVTTKSLGRSSFQSCGSLTEISIPANVESISDLVFNGCKNLAKVMVNITTPFEIGYRVFDDTNNCPIYVPNESVEAYKTTAGWSAYADRIVGLDVNGSVVGPDPHNPD